MAGAWTSEKASCDALRHPIRVRILEVMCDRDLSPIQFIQDGMLPPGVTFKDEQSALSHIAYHFRCLVKADCIVLVDTRQRRGATEHIYRNRALALPLEEDGEFGGLTLKERRAISRATLRSLVARADGAILLDTFDKRPDRHLSWVGMDLDEVGWRELCDLQTEALERAKAIKAASIARAQEVSRDHADPPFRGTFGALAFESPPITFPPVRR